jgi:hypothetical protein
MRSKFIGGDFYKVIKLQGLSGLLWGSEGKRNYPYHQLIIDNRMNKPIVHFNGHTAIRCFHAMTHAVTESCCKVLKKAEDVTPPQNTTYIMTKKQYCAHGVEKLLMERVRRITHTAKPFKCSKWDMVSRTSTELVAFCTKI